MATQVASATDMGPGLRGGEGAVVTTSDGAWATATLALTARGNLAWAGVGFELRLRDSRVAISCRPKVASTACLIDAAEVARAGARSEVKVYFLAYARAASSRGLAGTAAMEAGSP